MKKISTNDIRFLQRALLRWFTLNQRDLPWRHTYAPYDVWISEIMLQQTQVKTVLPYFERWIKTFPTIQSVASAQEEKILKLWEGLGYYSRARNLQKAAQKIVKNHHGKFPENYEDILALPGIGRYTAGAIASIAYNQPQPILDGNMIRVIARLLAEKRNTRKPQLQAQFWAIAKSWIPAKDARNFNQAMMELGALVCTPKSPDCKNCPLKKQCHAYALDLAESLPNRGKSQKKVEIKVVAAILVKKTIRASSLIFIQKRPQQGLMGGLWEFPGGKVKPKESLKDALCREIREELGIEISNLRPFLNIKHSYTKYNVDFHTFLVDCTGEKIKQKEEIDHAWVPIEKLSKLPFPAANVKVIKALVKGKIETISHRVNSICCKNFRQK
ncbi:MAG: A/G-specific adenine glycosylase [Candidatus Gracilibacteria bacterium]